MIRLEQLIQIREAGLFEDRYPPGDVIDRGGYSLILRHWDDPGLVVKVTCCQAIPGLWAALEGRASSNFVRVLHTQLLEGLPGCDANVTLFVLERLQPLTEAQQRTLEHHIDLVTASLSGPRRLRRGTAEYQQRMVSFCEAFATIDPERGEGWQQLAWYLRERADAYHSVDILTEGNLLRRGDQVVLSDPIRRLVPSP